MVVQGCHQFFPAYSQMAKWDQKGRSEGIFMTSLGVGDGGDGILKNQFSVRATLKHFKILKIGCSSKIGGTGPGHTLDNTRRNNRG
jgi:hypothetical protein